MLDIPHPASDPTPRGVNMFTGGTAVAEPVSNQPENVRDDQPATSGEAISQIRDSLRGLRFGSVNIIVQDGVVIQIDRTEKKRLRTPRTNG